MNKFRWMFGALAWGLSCCVLAAPAVPEAFQRLGIKVLSSAPGPSGLTLWTVERPVQGQAPVRSLLMTTPDGASLISGVVWDAKSGANLSDSFIAAAGVGPQGGEPSRAAGPVKVLVDEKGVPLSISDIDKKKGVREGKGGVAQTLYVIFDPQCPHCHNLYKALRPFVAAGMTVKWIPTAVVGGARDSKRLIAEFMQASKPEEAFRKVMADEKYVPSATPDSKTQVLLADNAAYLFDAFKQNPGAGSPVVPVVFFATKQGGAQMVAGVEDADVLTRIREDMKK